MPASQPTPEELLRLARESPITRDVLDVVQRDLARLHLAAKVLSGELDVAELLAERDRLRVALTAVHAVGQIPAGGPVQAIVEAALKEDP